VSRVQELAVLLIMNITEDITQSRDHIKGFVNQSQTHATGVQEMEKLLTKLQLKNINGSNKKEVFQWCGTSITIFIAVYMFAIYHY